MTMAQTAQTMTGWLTRGARLRAVETVDLTSAYTTAVLPDGQLMQVRKTSLASAKDYLAAKHAIERRMRDGR